MKAILVGILAVLVLGIGGWQVYDRYLAGPDVPPAVVHAERALATPELVALASLDVAALARLEEELQGEPSEAGADDPEETDALTDWIGDLGIDPRRDVTWVVAALHALEEGDLGLAFAVFGHFDPAAFEAALRGDPGSDVREARVGGQRVLVVDRKDPDDCEESKIWVFHLSPARVLVADPGSFEVLLARLGGQSPAGRSLDRYHAFRGRQLASLALFIPETLPAASENPLVGMAAASAREGLQGFDALYLGAGVSLLPPGLSLRALLHAIEAPVADEVARRWTASLAESRAQWQKIMPTAAALHDALTIESEGRELSLEATLDRDFAQELTRIPGELMQLMFSGLGSGATTAAASPAPDQLDPSPRVFRAELPFEKVPAYDASAPFAGAVDAASGPFGVRVNSLSLTSDPSAGIEIEVEAVGTGVANLGEDQERAFLEVTRVVGPNGEDLLREESCGRDRNDLPAPLSDRGGVLTASKRVRLQPEVTAAEVAGLAGRIRLALPVRTETVRLSAPEPGARVERAGAVLQLTEVGARSVGYRVSGSSRRLLHLRALNREKKPLLRRGGSSMDALFGSGRSGFSEFAGEVAYVEAVFAIEEEVRGFPFELASVLPGTAGEMTEDVAPSFVAYSHAKLEKQFARALKTLVEGESEPLATARTGPFTIALEDLQSFLGLRSRIVVHTPPIPNVEHSLSALELELQQIRLRDGTVQRGSPDPFQAPWQTSLSIARTWGEDGLSGWAWLDTGLKAEVEAVESLAGVVHLRHPTGVRTLALEPAALGQSADDGGGLRVTLSRVARDSFTLSGPADGRRVLGVTALNAEGKRLVIQHAQLNETDRGWSAVFRVSGVPQRLEVAVATGIERVDYGFVLRLDEDV